MEKHLSVSEKTVKTNPPPYPTMSPLSHTSLLSNSPPDVDMIILTQYFLLHSHLNHNAKMHSIVLVTPFREANEKISGQAFLTFYEL